MNNLKEEHIVGLYDLSKLTYNELIYLIDNLRAEREVLVKQNAAMRGMLELHLGANHTVEED